MRKNKNISISELASYADNPIKFCRNRGGANNKENAAFGTKQHNKIVKSHNTLILFILVVIGLGYYFGIY